MAAKNNTSGYTGVSYYPRNNSWRVLFRNRTYGYCISLEEAVELRAKVVAQAPPLPRKRRPQTTSEQRTYASMHAEHQVLRAKYRKLLAKPVSLTPEARHAFEEEYEAIRLRHYPRITHAPQDLSSWESRRINYEENTFKTVHGGTFPIALAHEWKKLPTSKEYLGLSAKGQVAQLRQQYRLALEDPTLNDNERRHLRKLLSFHIAGVMKFKF